MNSFTPRYHIADFFKFTAILCLTLALWTWNGAVLAFRADWPRSLIWPFGLAAACALAFMRSDRTYPRCESCGKRIVPTRNAEPSSLCRSCRIPKLPPRQRRHLAIQGFIIIFIFLLIVASIVAYLVVGFMRVRHGWFAYPLITIGLFVMLLILAAGSLVLRSLVRIRRMSHPAYALRVARNCAVRLANRQRSVRCRSTLLRQMTRPPS